MAARRGRRTKIDGAFAPRTIEMISSPPFRALSLSARKVLDRLEVELASHGGKDNGNLPCTFDDFQRFGIGDRHCIGPALREAEALGFIERTVKGVAGAEVRQPSMYRLTYRHTDHSEPTNEWRRIKTEEEAILRARAARLPVKDPARKNKRPVRETTLTPVRETTPEMEKHQ
jgi:hypothetical protein